MIPLFRSWHTIWMQSMYEADCIFSMVSWQTVREAQKQTVCGRLLCFYDERKHSGCSLPVFIWKQRILQCLCTADVIFQFVHEYRDAAKSKTYGSQWKKQHLSKQRCLLLRVMFSRICMDSMWIFRMHSKGIFLYIGESAQIPYEFILMCANADSSL